MHKQQQKQFFFLFERQPTNSISHCDYMRESKRMRTSSASVFVLIFLHINRRVYVSSVSFLLSKHILRFSRFSYALLLRTTTITQTHNFVRFSFNRCATPAAAQLSYLLFIGKCSPLHSPRRILHNLRSLTHSICAASTDSIR